MRVPHALAAVAAFGALVYGVSDPLSSALAARTQAKESSQLAAQAEAAADAPAVVPAAAHTRTGHRSAPAKTKPVSAPGKAKPARTASAKVIKQVTPLRIPATPNLSDISHERDQHRASVAETTPAPAADRTTAPARPAVRPQVMAAQESYGPSSSQRVTVSRLNTASGKRPTVYFVHGGSWIGGSSHEWQSEASRWAAQGWTAVNIDYRVNVPGRLMLGDVRTVVTDFERRPYVDPGKQIIVGSSAGGHLAASIAVRYPKEFRGVIAWSPVISPQVAAAEGIHTSTLSSRYRLAQAARRLWGGDWHSATPVSYVSSQSPPLWAAAGRGEWLRWSDQGSLLCAAMGSRCTANVVPGAAHGAQLAQSHPALRRAALAWATKEVE